MKENEQTQQTQGKLSIEEIGKKYFPCTCGEIYLSRKLTAPDCFYHNEAWQEAIEEYTEQFNQPTQNYKWEQLEHLAFKERLKECWNEAREGTHNEGTLLPFGQGYKTKTFDEWYGDNFKASQSLKQNKKL